MRTWGRNFGGNSAAGEPGEGANADAQAGRQVSDGAKSIMKQRMTFNGNLLDKMADLSQLKRQQRQETTKQQA